MGTQRGQPLWAHNVDSHCGRTTWTAIVGAQRGQPLWAHNVDSHCGRTTWTAIVGAHTGKNFAFPLMELILGTARFQGQKPINGNVVQNRVWVFSWDFMGSHLGNIAFHYGFFCISILVFPNSVHCTPWDSPKLHPVTPWVY